MSLRTPDPLYAFREVLETRLRLSFHVARYETWGAQKEIKISDDSLAQQQPWIQTAPQAHSVYLYV